MEETGVHRHLVSCHVCMPPVDLLDCLHAFSENEHSLCVRVGGEGLRTALCLGAGSMATPGLEVGRAIGWESWEKMHDWKLLFSSGRLRPQRC